MTDSRTPKVSIDGGKVWTDLHVGQCLGVDLIAPNEELGTADILFCQVASTDAANNKVHVLDLLASTHSTGTWTRADLRNSRNWVTLPLSDFKQRHTYLPTRYVRDILALAYVSAKTSATREQYVRRALAGYCSTHDIATFKGQPVRKRTGTRKAVAPAQLTLPLAAPALPSLVVDLPAVPMPSVTEYVPSGFVTKEQIQEMLNASEERCVNTLYRVLNEVLAKTAHFPAELTAGLAAVIAIPAWMETQRIKLEEQRIDRAQTAQREDEFVAEIARLTAENKQYAADETIRNIRANQASSSLRTKRAIANGEKG